MAQAKKASAKRTVRTAKKTATKAANASHAVAKSAANKQREMLHNSAAWAQQSASEWQKGADAWAKQSAKLYQLPFAGNEATEVTKQAAATVQSATEKMVRASNDMMQQMFGSAGADPMAQLSRAFTSGSMPNPQEFASKFQHVGREMAEQMNKATQGASRAANEMGELTRENAEALVQCSNIAIAVSKDIGAELISYANKSFSQNVELGKQLLACRTLNDMFDMGSKFMKVNLDGFFSESVKLSEKLFQCATDVSEPLNERVSESSERLSRAVGA